MLPGSQVTDVYELELQVLRPLPVDQNDIQCFSVVGSYSQIGGPNFPPDDIDHCILIDIPSDDQIPVQPGDVVGFYYDLLRNNDGSIQLNVLRPDITAFYRERASIPAPSPSSCMLIAGPNNIELLLLLLLSSVSDTHAEYSSTDPYCTTNILQGHPYPSSCSVNIFLIIITLFVSPLHCMHVRFASVARPGAC